MEKRKSLLEQRLEQRNPKLVELLRETVEKYEKAAEKQKWASVEAEIISAADLAVVVNVRAEDDLLARL